MLSRKNRYVWIALACLGLILAGLLAGCSAGASAAGAAETSASAGQLPLVMQLAIGTLKLEGTGQAVDAAQAAKLLPLWKAARSLGKSATTATVESNGLVKQIQQTLTSEQLQAIQEMGLNMQNLPSVAQELGLELAPSGAPAGGAAPAAAAASGGAPAGGPPDMGGMPGGGPPPGMASSGSTSQAAKSDSSAGSFLGLNPALLNAVIEFLTTRAQ